LYLAVEPHQQRVPGWWPGDRAASGEDFCHASVAGTFVGGVCASAGGEFGEPGDGQWHHGDSRCAGVGEGAVGRLPVAGDRVDVGVLDELRPGLVCAGYLVAGPEEDPHLARDRGAACQRLG
jgi:hypothetical protein